MSITLTTLAGEQSAYIVDVSFFDENNLAVIPNDDLVWTLTDANGVVVNSQEEIALVPAATVHIVLKGLDLAVGEGLLGTERRVLVKCTYNSDLGNNIPLTEQITFSIDNYTAITGIT